MYIGFYNYYNEYNKNKMFTDKSSPIGDDLSYPMVFLKEYLEGNGHRVCTIDMDRIERFDAIVFIDYPTFKNEYFRSLVDAKYSNLYLLLLESLIHRPDNYNEGNHKYFKKVFTWDDRLVDNRKYFKINYSFRLPQSIGVEQDRSKKLCAMVIGHKRITHELELYTERIKAVRWFENNFPEDFDLYGIGWDKYIFRGVLGRLNNFDLLAKILKPHYPSYRGRVKSKKEILSKYKFAICYENAKDISGYITEKIFDCFFAGCVPIYLGADNVTQYIPKECFIDKRNYNAYEDLHKYLINMPDKEYTDYLNSINNFINTDRSYLFSAKYFAKTIRDEIANAL